MSRNAWVSSEIAQLRLLYVKTPHRELEPLFPRHPLSSIVDMAHSLGLRKPSGSKLRAQSRWSEIAARHVFTVRFDQGQQP